jgi:hypothetical protein
LQIVHVVLSLHVSQLSSQAVHALGLAEMSPKKPGPQLALVTQLLFLRK